MKGTKIHAVVSLETLPLSIQVGPGDEHDLKYSIKLLEGVRVKHGLSRPRRLRAIQHMILRRLELKRRGIKANINVNPRNRSKPKRRRPYRLDRKVYESMRSAVESFFAWITLFRRITIRYERLASIFLGFIQVACIIIYLRVLIFINI
ncbi:MAG: transposase [Nitrososphaerales archaeon]